VASLDSVLLPIQCLLVVAEVLLQQPLMVSIETSS